MTTRVDDQRAFLRALRDGSAFPDGLRVPTGVEGGDRFRVYRNNVHGSLVRVLESTYPILLRLLGAQYFQQLANAFVARALPHDPVLHEYGGEFAAFIEQRDDLDNLPYLADVARVEWAQNRAYHAADAEPLTPGALADTTADLLPDAQLVLHPSVQLLRSRWPVFSIWRTNRHDAEVESVRLDQCQDVLIARPWLEVEVHRLPGGVHAFVRMLGEGWPLAEAAAAAEAEAPGFEPGDVMYRLLTAGIFAQLQQPDRPACRSPTV